jgi:hypothetical protein
VSDRVHTAKASFVVTTEKDGVRLEGVARGGLKIATVPLTATIEPSDAFADWLFERLNRARTEGERL